MIGWGKWRKIEKFDSSENVNIESAEWGIMPYVYDDLYEICRERRFLIDWLQELGLLGEL